METVALKYTIIKNREQYDRYCEELEYMVTHANSGNVQDEIDLLTLLIAKYDDENNSFNETDPILLLRSLMADHGLKQKDITAILGISKGYTSDILNYKKGLSKDVIRKPAEYFKVKQEAFNRPYQLG